MYDYIMFAAFSFISIALHCRNYPLYRRLYKDIKKDKYVFDVRIANEVVFSQTILDEIEMLTPISSLSKYVAIGDAKEMALYFCSIDLKSRSIMLPKYRRRIIYTALLFFDPYSLYWHNKIFKALLKIIPPHEENPDNRS